MMCYQIMGNKQTVVEYDPLQSLTDNERLNLVGSSIKHMHSIREYVYKLQHFNKGINDIILEYSGNIKICNDFELVLFAADIIKDKPGYSNLDHIKISAQISSYKYGVKSLCDRLVLKHLHDPKYNDIMRSFMKSLFITHNGTVDMVRLCIIPYIDIYRHTYDNLELRRIYLYDIMKHTPHHYNGAASPSPVGVHTQSGRTHWRAHPCHIWNPICHMCGCAEYTTSIQSEVHRKACNFCSVPL